MTGQTDVRAEHVAGIPGEKYTPEGHAESFSNADGQAEKVVDVVVDSAVADTEYKLDDVVGEEISITSGSSPTLESIRDKLLNAMRDNGFVTRRLEVLKESTDQVRLRSLEVDDDFTVTETDANLSLEDVQAAGAAKPVPYGILVGRDPDISKQAARLPDATDYDVREISLTLDGSTDGDYRVSVRYFGNNYYDATYTASADSDSVILSALATELENNIPYITASESSGTLTLVSETAGFADFDVVEAEGPSSFDETIVTAGESFEDHLAGFTMPQNRQYIDENPGAYNPNEPMKVRVRGDAYVKPDVLPSSLDDVVHVCMDESGKLDQLGQITPETGAGLVPLRLVKFVEVFDITAAAELKREH